MGRKTQPDDQGPVMGRDPLAADEEVLARTFYGRPGEPGGAEPSVEELAPPPRTSPSRRRRARKAKKPGHYRIVSISLYNEDIERIDALVQELKASGHPKANRSALIRYAIDTVDISRMPRSY